MKLGIHASVRNGYDAALSEARALGVDALQILPYPRRTPNPPEEMLKPFNAARRAAGVQILIVHSRFVPNPASSEETRRLRSVRHLAHELSLSAALGADAYVIHGGAYSEGSTLDQGAKLFTDSIFRAVEQSGCLIPLYLENVPGGGRRMGGSLEELARLYEPIQRRFGTAGVCLDTAHAYAAGYDGSTAEGMLKFIARAHRLMGFDAVKAFHLNDTRALLNSNRENHEHWGKGRLGSEGLKALLAREEFADTPGILETPKDGPDSDRANLAFAKALA